MLKRFVAVLFASLFLQHTLAALAQDSLANPLPTASPRPWPKASFHADFPCDPATVREKLNEAQETLADEDYSKGYVFVLYGEEQGTCYRNYSFPPFLYGKAFFFFAAARSSEHAGNFKESFDELRVSNEALKEMQGFDLDLTWIRLGGAECKVSFGQMLPLVAYLCKT